MSCPRVQLGGLCRRSAPLQHAQNETERVSQVQLQCKQPWGKTGNWHGELSWPKVELGSRCQRPAPCGLAHKHRMKGNEVPHVQRQSKAEAVANLSWPGKLSWPRVQLGCRCRSPAPCGLAQNETERVSQVQLQCQQPCGTTGSWNGELSWPRLEVGGRCRRPAPCLLAHKHKMKGNEVPQVQRESKA